MEPVIIYDNYEISGCRRKDDKTDPHLLGDTVVRCEDEDAVIWTIYGHIDGQAVEAIGHFPDRKTAENVYQRIVGEPFAASCQAGGRLKLMHAAPRLLQACQMIVDHWKHGDLDLAARACNDAVAAAMEPCPPWASADFDIAVVLERKRQIASIWSIEDVQDVRPDLTDQQAWEVLEATDHYHDVNSGICWNVLSCHAELLFGEAPETDDEKD